MGPLVNLLSGKLRQSIGPGTDRMSLQEFLGTYGTRMAFPPCANEYAGKYVVLLGDARCVWDDLERFGCAERSNQGKVWKSGWHFFTVNKVVETFPGDIEHAYSNEPNTLLRFIEARRVEYRREFNMPQNTHSITPGCKYVWPWGGHGTSGLGACLTAVGLGYTRIVLCGMPLDNSGHNGEPHWRRGQFQSSEAAGSVTEDINGHWKTARDLGFDGKVRSMSGRTKDWLGDGAEWA
jgi:hypothetical protein